MPGTPEGAMAADDDIDVLNDSSEMETVRNKRRKVPDHWADHEDEENSPKRTVRSPGYKEDDRPVYVYIQSTENPKALFEAIGKKVEKSIVGTFGAVRAMKRTGNALRIECASENQRKRFLREGNISIENILCRVTPPRSRRGHK